MADSTRTTIYLDKDLHRALQLKSAATRRSISELVTEAVREALREDQEDLEEAQKRSVEAAVTYVALLKRLKAAGTL